MRLDLQLLRAGESSGASRGPREKLGGTVKLLG